jgi:hypothetical protein
METDPDLSPIRMDINSSIVIRAYEGPISRRRLRQLLYFFSQCCYMFSGLAKRESELFILRNCLSKLSFGFKKTFLKGCDSLWCIDQLASEKTYLRFKSSYLTSKRGYVPWSGFLVTHIVLA